MQLTVVILVLVLLSVSLEFTDGWQWSWTCVEGQCVRSENVDTQGVKDTGKSLEVCQLACGPYGSLWPQPTGPTFISGKVIHIHPARVQFETNVAGNQSEKQELKPQEYLNKTTQRFVSNLIELCNGNCSDKHRNDVFINITTTSSNTRLHLRTDESYVLHVGTKGGKVEVNVTAKTIYGARHALETLNQLIACYSADSQHYLVIVTSAGISDKPAYDHRGLMLDTARHFIPMQMIKRSMDAMAMSKMNVFHWHATDTHSFPLDVPSHPEFARYGAYSSKETYSKEDMAEIVRYGRERGIRVIMEIDAPAHAGNGWQWGKEKGLGDLAVCVNKQPWRHFCVQPPCGQLNPVNPNTYKVLRSLYRDLINIFPKGEMFHMGGDEVFIGCWDSTDEIREWLKKHNRTTTESDYMKLWTEFQDKALQIYDDEANNTRTSIILWSSDLTDPRHITLDPERYIIEAWSASHDPSTQHLLKKGYKIILAPKDVWYLDHGFWGDTRYSKWTSMYDYKPPDSNNILGGEACMWSELVDEYNMEPKIWPRAAAVAERLWSNPNTSSEKAEARFFQFRERLVKFGIRPEAVTPEWCYQHEGECPRR